MTVIEEGDLEFVFGDGWTVRKYDANGAFYKTQMAKRVKPTKAVDFLCLCEGQPLLVLEAKDFSRGVPKRDKFDKISMVVALKARDTIAGIVGGAHRASDTDERSFLQNSRKRLVTPPRVIYFFEDLCTPARRPRQRAANKRDVLLKQLKQHLRWLTTDVAVVGLRDYEQFITDLTVRRV